MPPSNFTKPLYIFFLVLPFGISVGFVTVALPYLLTQKGISVETAAGIVALGFSANLWRFLWGPVADMTLTLRRWYWIGVVACAATLLLLCLIPYSTKGILLITVIVFISQVAATFVVLPVGSFMAHCIEEHKKGRAGGWYQAGNMGGMGLGGGAGLFLSTHYSIPIAGAAMCLLIGLASLIVFLIKDVPCDKEKGILMQVRTMGKDLVSMLRVPVILFVIIVACMPMGTGAASNLWSAVATDWKVNADTIALVTGIVSGLVSAVGCIIGGWIADRLGIWWAYLGSGIAGALVALAMAAFPYQPMVYVYGVLVYAFALGLANAGFTAMALFATGKKAAATKYSLLLSIGNIPVVYMTSFDGWAHDHGGSKYMLVTEALLAIVFVMICLVVLKWMKQKNILARPVEV